MEVPDLDVVLESEQLRGMITPDDKKLLQYFIVNLRTRRKKERDADTKRQELQHHISEKGKNFVS
jgi:phage terminase large subunit-like protein